MLKRTKISYANVKMIYDLSMQDGSTPPPGPGTVKTVNDSGAIAKSAWKQYGPFKVAAGQNLTAALEGCWYGLATGVPRP